MQTVQSTLTLVADASMFTEEAPDNGICSLPCEVGDTAASLATACRIQERRKGNKSLHH